MIQQQDVFNLTNKTLFLSKNLTWHKIADSTESIPLSKDGLAEITIAGKKLCVALHKDQITACASRCPHAGGILSDGYIDALGNIVCPLHRYKFSLQNGRNVSGEGYFLKTYPIEQREDGIYVGLEENSLFGWLK
jgi:nitrite reductase/ring-hydroxylating ferredoxin subunit